MSELGPVGWVLIAAAVAIGVALAASGILWAGRARVRVRRVESVAGRLLEADGPTLAELARDPHAGPLGPVAELIDARTEERDLVRRRLEAITDGSPDVIIRLNRDLVWIYANAALERLVGIAPSRVVGHRAVDGGVPEDVVREWSPVVDEVLASGRPGEITAPYPLPDRNLVLHALIVPEFSADGGVENVLMVVRDVTVREMALRALRDSEERYRSVVAGSTSGLLMLGRDGTVLAANSAAEGLLEVVPGGHFPLNGMARTSGARLLDGNGRDLPPGRWPIAHTFSTGTAMRDVLVGVSRPGGRPVVWVRVSTEPVRHPGGHAPHAVVLSFVDVTHQLETERHLRDARDAALSLAEERSLAGRIATAVAAERPQDEVFALIASGAAMLLDAGVGVIVQVTSPDEGAMVGGWWAQDAPLGRGRTGRVVLAESGVVGEAAQRGRAVRRQEGCPGSVWCSGPQVGVPIWHAGRLWGVLAIGWSDGAVPAERDHERLASFSGMVSLAVSSVEARGRLAGHVAEQAALRAVATAVARGMPPDDVMDLVAAEVAGVLGARVGAVVRRIGAGIQLEVAGVWIRGGDPHAGAAGLLADRGAAMAALRAGSAAVVPVEDGEGAPADGDAATVAVPVRSGSDLWGALVAVVDRASDGAGEAASRVLTRFGELVALAVTAADARRRLEGLASTDGLTGLPNQRAFRDALEAEVARSERSGRPLSLVMIDVDHFKQVNDGHGHDVGDRVLQEVARRLRLQARAGEVLARVGGEEFGWILPDVTGEEAEQAAERARAAVRDLAFDAVGMVTVSAGVCDLSEAETAGGMYRLADAALYWAKASGRDCVTRYTSSSLELLSRDEQSRRMERVRALAGLRALAAVVDARDPSTQRHSERVAELAERLALRSGWPPDRARLLHEAALVHDVGKIAVPDAVLFAPRVLTDEEFDQVRTHASTGAEIVEGALSAEQVRWVRHHHERFDGSGYPDGLAGTAIDEGAALLAVADAWDAMTTARAHSAPLTSHEAIAECRRGRGRQFSPVAVDTLEALWDEGDPLLQGAVSRRAPVAARVVPLRPAAS